MKNLLAAFIFLIFLLVLTQPAHSQLRRKKNPPPKNEIDSPKERLKSRSKSQEETKVKVKKKRNYVEKRSKRNTSKNRVSQKSIETVVPIEDSKAFSQKRKKPLKSLKKAKNKADEIADSEGSVRVKRPGSDKNAVSNEKITHTVKERSLRKQRRENEKRAKTIAGSEGEVRVKRFGSDKASVSNEKVTQTIKVKSTRRQRKSREDQAEKLAGSDGPVQIKREEYRKRPGTIYREDQKGGSKYRSQGESGAFTYKGMSPEKKEKKIARKSQNASNFEGDTKIAKRDKDMHPSAEYYLEAKKKKSHEEKEKLRKKELRKSRTRNGGQPKVVTEKRKKPKYDTRESEIWYE